MKKILIVDDEKISLMMTEHILQTQYETVCASCGQEAFEIFRQETPDLILTDLRMPGMSGIDLIEKLKAESGHSVPVMFMTADDSHDAEIQGFESGAVDYIRKPFRADILLRRIDNILQNVERIEGLTHAASTDPMTGLLNKSSSHLSIDRMCHDTQGVFMMIDLDSFKAVNDIYGHDMGDKILIRFSEILRSAVRSTDIIGRIGGDEFVAFCQHISDEEVIADKSRYINEELLRSAHEFMGEDMDIPLGASIGAAIAPTEGNDYTTLFGKADKALYDVKQNGKHGYLIYHEVVRDTNEDDTGDSGIAEAMSIMSERNRSKGAFSLPIEQFTLLYRFLSRMEQNYHEGNRLIIFNLRPKSSIPVEKKVSEEFYNTLCQSLRASDVATQSSKSRAMVLLLESNQMYAEMVIDRIIDTWNQNGLASECEVTFEMAIIQ